MILIKQVQQVYFVDLVSEVPCWTDRLGSRTDLSLSRDLFQKDNSQSQKQGDTSRLFLMNLFKQGTYNVVYVLITLYLSTFYILFSKLEITVNHFLSSISHWYL